MRAGDSACGLSRVAGRGVLEEHRCCVDTQDLLMVFLFP